ncbi:YcaO-like family protein [Rhizobium mongolense]|uniref:YcaO-like family protein n=1 Tax=Rhizobium mongolense TaxID=57676 RepID=UPI003557236C
MVDGASLERLLVHGPPPPDPWETARKILAERREFGITRLGSVTELDRVGIPVAQVVRPMSRSVTVNQGKGLTFPQAAISGLMESLEGWASERIPQERVEFAELMAMNKEGYWSHLLPQRDCNETLAWIEGWDLFSHRPIYVPLALVDTAYTMPSPHPRWLPRNTTGLAAGTSLQQAIMHASLEALERHARCAAMKMPHFFDRYQLDSNSVRTRTAAAVVERLVSAGFAIGIWSIPTEHDLPVYWCHIMESDRKAPLAPWPAEGFGCDVTHDRALTKALLEACQSRLGVISAAREDIAASQYGYQSTSELAAWRRQLSIQGLPCLPADQLTSVRGSAQKALDALRVAGATAVIVVILFSDESIPLHVVRVVTPPLETNPEYNSGR